MKDLLKKLLTFDGTIHKYVYLRKDEKGCSFEAECRRLETEIANLKAHIIG